MFGAYRREWAMIRPWMEIGSPRMYILWATYSKTFKSSCYTAFGNADGAGSRTRRSAAAARMLRASTQNAIRQTGNDTVTKAIRHPTAASVAGPRRRVYKHNLWENTRCNTSRRCMCACCFSHHPFVKMQVCVVEVREMIASRCTSQIYGYWKIALRKRC